MPEQQESKQEAASKLQLLTCSTNKAGTGSSKDKGCHHACKLKGIQGRVPCAINSKVNTTSRNERTA